MYVRGLKERSEAAEASRALRPCQLCSMEQEEEEEVADADEDSQGCLLKASLSVAFTLSGRSREESARLQLHVWLGG